MYLSYYIRSSTIVDFKYFLDFVSIPDNMDTISIMFSTNKRYFIEDKFLIIDCFYNQKNMKLLHKDWIGLYPCENIKLHNPLIFEYVMDHPRVDDSCFKIRFISKLFSKFIHCSGKYQFVYVDSFFKIIATSDPIEFLHKNNCNCNMTLVPTNCMVHMKDINLVIQRLKYLEAKLLNYEDGKKEAVQLHEQLVKKLKLYEILEFRGEQFIEGLYNALNQGKPVKITNSKGHTRWIKRMRDSNIKNNIVSTKTLKNDLYLTAIINNQELGIQILSAINDKLKIQLSKYNEQVIHISDSEFSESGDTNGNTQVKSFTIKTISSEVVKFIDDSELSDDYCE